MRKDSVADPLYGHQRVHQSRLAAVVWLALVWLASCELSLLKRTHSECVGPPRGSEIMRNSQAGSAGGLLSGVEGFISPVSFRPLCPAGIPPTLTRVSPLGGWTKDLQTSKLLAFSLASALQGFNWVNQ